MNVKIVEKRPKSAVIKVFDDNLYLNVIAEIEIYENLLGEVFIDVEPVEERVKAKVK